MTPVLEPCSGSLHCCYTGTSSLEGSGGLSVSQRLCLLEVWGRSHLNLPSRLSQCCDSALWPACPNRKQVWTPGYGDALHMAEVHLSSAVFLPLGSCFSHKKLARLLGGSRIACSRRLGRSVELLLWCDLTQFHFASSGILISILELIYKIVKMQTPGTLRVFCGFNIIR